MSVKPTISALITNYNTAAQTRRCVEALLRHSPDVLHIVVVDDASTEPLDLAQYPQVEVIRHVTNGGYPQAVNTGFAHSKGEVVLLLDSDAYPTSDLATVAAELFRDPTLGVAGMYLHDEHGRQTGSKEPEPSVWPLILGQQLGARWQRLTAGQSDEQPMVYFSCGVAIRRTCFEELGGFDTSFDFLDADVDFSMRVNRSGWKSRFSPQLTAYHVGGGSPQSTQKRLLRVYKNRWKLLQKHQLTPVPRLAIGLILVRLGVEYLGLLLVGRLRYAGPTYADKLAGRSNLIKLVGREFFHQLAGR